MTMLCDVHRAENTYWYLSQDVSPEEAIHINTYPSRLILFSPLSPSFNFYGPKK